MNNELPSVFANKIDEKIDNSQEVFYEKKYNNKTEENDSINKKINTIFNSSDYVYKKDVKITMDDKIFDTTIVGINNKYLLTMDNSKIDINKIKDIEVIKKYD